MKQDQTLDQVRIAMGLIAGFALGHHWGDPQLWTLITGIALAVVPAIWGYLAHTDSANIATVESIPQVQKIVVDRFATDGVADAAADPTRPKVVTSPLVAPNIGGKTV